MIRRARPERMQALGGAGLAWLLARSIDVPLRALEENPDAAALQKRTHVTVLFLDIEGYARLSEQAPPSRCRKS